MTFCNYSGDVLGVGHLLASVGPECTYAYEPEMDNCFNECCLHHLHRSGKFDKFALQLKLKY